MRTTVIIFQKSKKKTSGKRQLIIFHLDFCRKQMLDEDIRDVRLLQEKYLEDGELHSDSKRERKFRWKNIG